MTVLLALIIGLVGALAWLVAATLLAARTRRSAEGLAMQAPPLASQFADERTLGVQDRLRRYSYPVVGMACVVLGVSAWLKLFPAAVIGTMALFACYLAVNEVATAERRVSTVYRQAGFDPRSRVTTRFR